MNLNQTNKIFQEAFENSQKVPPLVNRIQIIPLRQLEGDQKSLLELYKIQSQEMRRKYNNNSELQQTLENKFISRNSSKQTLF